MTPAQKLERVAALNRAVSELASTRLRAQYIGATPHELKLRLAALRLEARVMREVFNWDPARHGLQSTPF